MKTKSALRLYNTVRHLKWKQIMFQIYYRVRSFYYKLPVCVEKNIENITIWDPVIYNRHSCSNKQFCFLNIDHIFQDTVDWNFSGNGKLWTYNLNYFEFLNSCKITSKEGLYLMKDYYAKRYLLNDGLEPYPTSLRIINWIKFLSFHQINDSQLNGAIVSDVVILNDHLEYHILANHLLENSFALYMASVYLDDKDLNSTSKKLLRNQLNEQILKDGAHYEQSPMYHQIILYRLLDVIHFNNLNNVDTDVVLIKKAKQMLCWLDNISFSNGDIPYVNDSAPQIAPTTRELLSYGRKLNLLYEKVPLSDSGYRKANKGDYEIMIDVANIASPYQPGHLHSDALQFIMYKDSSPLFVDTGVSTYEKNKIRNNERSSCAHNTVVVSGKNSYDVWGGFRVGKRSKLELIQDNDDKIEGSLHLYFGGQHNRAYELKDDQIIIEDRVSNSIDGINVAHFHLDHHRSIMKGNTFQDWIIDADIRINFELAKNVEIKKYQQAIGFNKTKEASKIVVTFANQLKTTIDI